MAAIDGTPGDDTLVGTNANDVIRGFGGNDTLIGQGGEDTLIGGTGDDLYFVNSLGDTVTEAANEGRDRVVALASYVLAANAEVETLETGSLSGTDAIDLTGSDFANLLNGNAGANHLNAGGGDDVIQAFGGADYLTGGAGFDILYGGAGDDAYYISDNAGDRIFESAGEGFDTVSSEVNFVIPDESEIERLEAGTLFATTPLVLGGSSSANTIIGNAGDNRLNGYGGDDTLQGLGGNDILIGDEGNDVMYGGTGDDTYYVDSPGDRIFEFAGEGTDRVATSVSYTLATGASIESLEAITAHETTAIDLIGNEFGNRIIGNDGANMLHGGAGDDVLLGLGGDDLLFGDAGNDRFLFGPAFGHDVIGDFAGNGAKPGDTVEFSAGTFSSFNDLMAHAAQQGTDVVFTLDANTSLTLHNVQLASLSAQDFTFA